MAMQTDVLASRVLITDGQMLDQAGNAIGRARIRAIRIIPTASSAGSVVFKDGGATGTTRLTVTVYPASTGPDFMLLPGEGLLFNTDIYADITTIGSVMVFYA
jgi:hypothetical protein